MSEIEKRDIVERLKDKPMYPRMALQREAAGNINQLRDIVMRYEWLINELRDMTGCQPVNIGSVSVEGHLRDIAAALGKVRDYA